MTWFKVDDNLAYHSKVVAAGNAAMGLWVRAGSWSAQYRTGGHIPTCVSREFGNQRLVDRLVDAGLWQAVEGGHQFHQWRSHQDGDYRPNIPPAVRTAVMERDGYRCTECHTADRLSLDHVIRYRDDGPDTVDNLRVLCMPCNWKRG